MSIDERSKSTEDRLRRGTSVDHVSVHWRLLPPHIREAIVMLVDASLLTQQQQASQGNTEVKNLQYTENPSRAY